MQGFAQTYKNGIYKGTAKGYDANISVEVVIENQKIQKIRVVEYQDSQPLSMVASLPETIVKKQSVKGIETISGATYSSKGLVKAVENALEKASVTPAAAAASSSMAKTGGQPVKESKETGTASSSMAKTGGQPVAKTKDATTAPVSGAMARTGGDVTKSRGGAKTSIGTGRIFPVPVWVIGSYDAAGKPNMMTAAWVGICCSDPPCVTISLRKATYTYGNIMRRKAFTVNIPSEAFADETWYFGRVSGRDEDKLAKTGLTPVRSTLVDAPYLMEFPLTAECRVIHTYEVGLHTMFIGQIMDIKADPEILGANDTPDVNKLRTFFYSSGTSSFHRTGSALQEPRRNRR
jgi:flavin reductase (DIM6/NTAB) family NADH-FMN oxidoreductase RutF/major membrane immunogen (membrane-anchored lipoprotein)